MSDLIIVKARFKILTAEEGGKRKGYIASGYRPNHIFEFFEGKFLNTFIGDITFIDRENMYPGDEAEVTVRFLKLGEIKRYIQVGRKWFINEANNPIGEAVILEISEI